MAARNDTVTATPKRLRSRAVMTQVRRPDGGQRGNIKCAIRPTAAACRNCGTVKISLDFSPARRGGAFPISGSNTRDSALIVRTSKAPHLPPFQGAVSGIPSSRAKQYAECLYQNVWLPDE